MNLGDANPVSLPVPEGTSQDPKQETLFDLGQLTVADPLDEVARHMNTEEPVTPAARLEVFRNALIKGMKFAYPFDVYSDVVRRLDAVVRATGAKNNSEALLRLLDLWDEKGYERHVA